ncbi:cytochrome B [Enterobacterales bacterium CwR94]|nr:cytochrome B [Enterobacterales bacterium CwR94]
MTKTTFHPAQRWVHWFMAVAIISMLFIGVGMVSTISDWHGTLVNLHKPLGIAILLLVVLRLGLRWRYGAPPLPASVSTVQQRVAQLSHLLLYVCMLLQPLLGWSMLSAAGYPVTLGDSLVLPPLVPESNTLYAVLRPLHQYVAFALFALVLMHIAAALLHGLVLRDGVFSSMTGRPSRRKKPHVDTE